MWYNAMDIGVRDMEMLGKENSDGGPLRHARWEAANLALSREAVIIIKGCSGPGLVVPAFAWLILEGCAWDVSAP